VNYFWTLLLYLYSHFLWNLNYCIQILTTMNIKVSNLWSCSWRCGLHCFMNGLVVHHGNCGFSWMMERIGCMCPPLWAWWSLSFVNYDWTISVFFLHWQGLSTVRKSQAICVALWPIHSARAMTKFIPWITIHLLMILPVNSHA